MSDLETCAIPSHDIAYSAEAWEKKKTEKEMTSRDRGIIEGMRLEKFLLFYSLGAMFKFEIFRK